MQYEIVFKSDSVAKMASPAIFQYNVLAIDDTHNTWTNVIVKMTILRLLGSSDDTGWTDARKVEYVGAMNSVAK